MNWTYFSLIDGDSQNEALHPVMSSADAQLPVALGVEDGDNIKVYAASAVRRFVKTGGKLTEQPKSPADLKWCLVVTDCRVITYCEKFDKGGGWVGVGAIGVGAAAAANAVSIARAVGRRRGKLLVGQVRYPWLMDVAASPKVDWRTVGLVRFSVKVPVAEELVWNVIEVMLKSDSDALAIGNNVVQRAAKFRLDNDPKLGDSRVGFEELSHAPIRQPKVKNHFKRKSWAEYSFPSAWRVVESTARLADIAQVNRPGIPGDSNT